MAPDLIPTILPASDWNAIVREGSGALGFSPAKIVDAHRSPLTPYAQYLVSLAAMHGYTNAITALHECHQARRHLLFGFLVYADNDTVFQLLERTPLAVVSATTLDKDRISQVSGTLDQWFDATLACCVPSATFNLRLLFDKAVLFFERAGLGEIWFEYRKKSLPDKTFLLEAK